MFMGQVWSKANFDGADDNPHLGGHGSILAVTAQGPGPDGDFGTTDDVLATLNESPVSVAVDVTVGSDCQDAGDRVRGFFSYHQGGASFVFADASVRFVRDDISQAAYLALSTIAGSETDDGEL